MAYNKELSMQKAYADDVSIIVDDDIDDLGATFWE